MEKGSVKDVPRVTSPGVGSWPVSAARLPEVGASVSVALVSLESVSCPLDSEGSTSSDVDSPGVVADGVPGQGSIKTGSPVKAYRQLFLRGVEFVYVILSQKRAYYFISHFHFIIYCNDSANKVVKLSSSG